MEYYPVITSVLGAGLLILQQVLLLEVGSHRGRISQGAGHGMDQDLERKIRRHGNLAENAAIFLIVLALLEMQATDRTIVLCFAVTFGMARLLHAFAFSSLSGSHSAEGTKFYQRVRFLGAFFTAISGIALGLYLLVQILPPVLG